MDDAPIIKKLNEPNPQPRVGTSRHVRPHNDRRATNRVKRVFMQATQIFRTGVALTVYPPSHGSPPKHRGEHPPDTPLQGVAGAGNHSFPVRNARGRESG